MDRSMTENSSSKADAMETETGSKELRIVTSVARTLAILERLSEQRCIHLEHLAMKTGLPKPTLHRFLASLVELGYVHRDANDRYSLTLRMLGIGSRGLAHMDMQETAYPVARQLGEHLHETVHMGVLDEDMAMYILKIESRYTLRMYSRIGKRIPLYCTAIGKVLLSGMREDQLEAYLLQSETIPFTRNTITDPLRLKEQL